MAPKRLSPEPLCRLVGFFIVAAPLLYGLGLLFERLRAYGYGPRSGISAFTLDIVGLFLLPLLAFSVPCGLLVWLLLAKLRQRYAARLSITLTSSLILGSALFVAGGQLRGIYGLDSPYFLFFCGAAIQIAGPLASLLFVARLLAAAVRQRSTRT